MNSYLIVAVVACLIQASTFVNAQGRTNLIEISFYSNCTGPEAGNYTLFDQWTLDLACDPTSVQLEPSQELVNTHPDGSKDVNVLKVLATSINPNGKFFELEILYLAESGPLAGKILYKQKELQNPSWLKKCSSVLGNSFDVTDGSQILFADQIDPFTVFDSPTGGLAGFQKIAKSSCQGVGYTF